MSYYDEIRKREEEIYERAKARNNDLIADLTTMLSANDYSWEKEVDNDWWKITKINGYKIDFHFRVSCHTDKDSGGFISRNVDRLKVNIYSPLSNRSRTFMEPKTGYKVNKIFAALLDLLSDIETKKKLESKERQEKADKLWKNIATKENKMETKFEGDYGPNECSKCGKTNVDICCDGAICGDGSHVGYAYCVDCCLPHYRGISNKKRNNKKEKADELRAELKKMLPPEQLAGIRALDDGKFKLGLRLTENEVIAFIAVFRSITRSSEVPAFLEKLDKFEEESLEKMKKDKRKVK